MVMAQHPARVAAATESSQQRKDQIALAIPRLTAQLALAQRQVWATARDNRDAPQRYRYAAGLSAHQKEALGASLRKHGSRHPTHAQFEESTLTGLQVMDLQTAQLAMRQHMPGVLEAANQLFAPSGE